MADTATIEIRYDKIMIRNNLIMLVVFLVIIIASLAVVDLRGSDAEAATNGIVLLLIRFPLLYNVICMFGALYVLQTIYLRSRMYKSSIRLSYDGIEDENMEPNSLGWASIDKTIIDEGLSGSIKRLYVKLKSPRRIKSTFRIRAKNDTVYILGDQFTLEKERSLRSILAEASKWGIKVENMSAYRKNKG